MLLCEQLGQEPDPDKMPLELSDFPGEVQVAFFMFSLLPESIVVQDRAETSERKRKQSEQKSKASGGKTYTHNIKG